MQKHSKHDWNTFFRPKCTKQLLSWLFAVYLLIVISQFHNVDILSIMQKQKFELICFIVQPHYSTEG